MFLKPKKGNLVAQFVVLIVIAVIMILIVTSLGSKIWQAFFPNTDKSTIKSFDAVYNILNAKSVSEQDYESTAMNIYLKDNYRIIFFNTETAQCDYSVSVSGGSSYAPTSNTYTGTDTYYAPKFCTSGKQCICLYKGAPQPSAEKKDNNVVKCYVIEKTMNIEPKYFDLDKDICDPDANSRYGSYLFVKHTYYSPQKISYIAVIKDTDENQKLNAEWAIPVCNKPNDDANGLCYEKKVGDILTATNEDSANKIYEYCNSKQIKSLGITCVYNENHQNCDPDCSLGDTSYSCHTYSYCDDINNIGGPEGVNYLSPEEDYPQYHICVNDNLFCNLGNCVVKTFELYTYKANKINGGSDSGGINDITLVRVRGDQDMCLEIMFDYPKEEFVTNINTSNPNCSNYADLFYDKSTIMACRKDKWMECNQFIKDKKNDCELKFMKEGDRYMLTHYKSDDNACKTEVDKLFLTAQFCRSAVTITTTNNAPDYPASTVIS